MIEITTMCETFNCLPSELLAEDPYWIVRMQQVLSTRNDLQKEKDQRASRSRR